MVLTRRPGAQPAVAVALAVVAIVAAIVVTWVVARQIVPGLGQRAGAPCPAVFSADRCAAIRSQAANELDVPPDTVSTIDIVSVRDPGATYLTAPGFVARVRVGDRVSDVRMCRGLRVTATPACPVDDQYP